MGNSNTKSKVIPSDNFNNSLIDDDNAIEKGAKLNSRGDTALMIALNDKKYDSAKLLIEKGQDLNLQNKYGETA